MSNKELIRLTWVRSEEHTSELQSRVDISYAVFCLKKKTTYSSSTSPSVCVTNLAQCPPRRLTLAAYDLGRPAFAAGHGPRLARASLLCFFKCWGPPRLPPFPPPRRFSV